MKKSLLLRCMVILIAVIGIQSCEKDKPMPKGDFTASVDGFAVTFTSSGSDITGYSWDFGDGNSSTDANPVHTYTTSGTYTVLLTLKGEGGSIDVSHDVEILPDFLEMLTGGPEAAEGKTWVMSKGYIDGVDGGSGVEPTMFLAFASMPDLLTNIGLPEEYDNEYTFFADGRYVVDNKNGMSLANLLFSLFGGVAGEVVETADADELNICAKEFSDPESATWTLHEDDLTVEAAVHGGTEAPAVTYNATFTGYKWIELSVGAYFGILDFPNNRKHFIIKSITPEQMSVAIFMAGYWKDAIGSGMYPTLMYHQTFVPKD